MRDEVAAERGMAREQHAPPSPASPHWRPAGRRRRSAAIAASSTPASLRAAADEDRVGRRQAGERGGRGALDDLEARARRTPRRCGGCARRGRRAPRWRCARSDGSASIHSIAIEPEPAPMSHSSSPRARRERRQRHGADLALGDLAVMLEQIVGEAGRAAASTRASRRGFNLDRHDVERVDVVEVEAVGASSLRMRSRGPPSASSTVSRDAPKPRLGEQRARAPPARRRPRSAPARARPDADAGGSGRAARPCSDTSVDVRQRPAEPRGGEAEGRRRRERPASRRRDMARQRRADAVEERIARGQHADLPAALRQHLARSRASNGLGQAAPRRVISAPASARCRLPPNTISASATRPRAHRRQARRRRPRRCRRWTASGAVRQRSAHERTQRAPCGASSSSAAPARRGSLPSALADARDLERDAVARRPHRRARAAAGAGAESAASAAPRGSPRYLRDERIDVLIDATHPYAARSRANAARGRARAPACRCSRCGARPGRRSPATAGSRSTASSDAVAALGERAAPRLPRARPAGARALRGRAAASLSRPQRRSGRPAARRAARDLHPGARAVRRGRRARAARRSIGIEVVVAKNSGGERDLRQDRGGARARHSRWSCCAGRRCRDVPSVDDASMRLSPGSIMRSPPRRRAACRPAARRPGRAITRVSRRADDDAGRHVGVRRVGRARASSRSMRSSGRPTARPKMTGVVAGRMRAQQLEGLAELPGPRLARSGCRARCTKPAPAAASSRRSISSQGFRLSDSEMRAEIVAERRADAGGDRQHRGDAGHDRRCRASRQAAGPASIASQTAAAMANTPGSPPETTATRRALARRGAARPRRARLPRGCRRRGAPGRAAAGTRSR